MHLFSTKSSHNLSAFIDCHDVNTVNILYNEHSRVPYSAIESVSPIKGVYTKLSDAFLTSYFFTVILAGR